LKTAGFTVHAFLHVHLRYAGGTQISSIGLAGNALLVVVYTIRSAGGREIIRLISARRATRHEETQYSQI
jgi:uncharacterized DUF497 family protein